MRFSLKKLWALVTVLAVALGVHQIRRRSILGPVDAFEREGAYMGTDRTWRDLVWQSVPRVAFINLKPMGEGVFELGSQRYDVAEAGRRVNELADRLGSFGVVKVEVVVRDEQGLPANTLRYRQGQALEWLLRTNQRLMEEHAAKAGNAK